MTTPGLSPDEIDYLMASLTRELLQHPPDERQRASWSIYISVLGEFGLASQLSALDLMRYCNCEEPC